MDEKETGKSTELPPEASRHNTGKATEENDDMVIDVDVDREADLVELLQFYHTLY